ncbi:MAG TPA: VIT1/CCC1 transporter family protein [Ktedonobacterales bacterium]|jgi:vacuolar iron transporter family protein|nr:VIT1/CCC1 transporter family protein [Ktedonobacterales bacterium]
MATDADIARYKANLQDERDSSMLYHTLAETEKDAHLAEIYRRLAAIEEKHAANWERLLQQSGQTAPLYRPGWRMRTLAFLARRFGASSILPMVSSMEANATHTYDRQPEALALGMPAEERSHARVFGYLRAATRGGIAGSTLAQLEGRHRNTGGGNALRAAVLGASDGLTSNMSLVMGVAGADLSGHAILLTGIAGLLAGALSMAIGEWLSVQSARELYTHQIDIERAELQDVPEEEREELTLIYQAKGLQESEAQRLADRLLADKDTALDTLAREELGIDPGELGGSAWQAAITSFLLFAAGAIIPVAPFAFGGGLTIVAISLALSAVGLFIIGAGITLTTGVPLLKAGGRQVLFGLAAAAITFGLGKLVGGRLG